MPEIPHDGRLDSSIALLADPYGFIGKRCARLDSDLFRTRLLLQTNICLRGRDAAELFYDDVRFTRRGAILKHIARVLTGIGGVQELEGEDHLHRKKLFISLITPDEAVRLAQVTIGHWRAAAARWVSQESATLYYEAREVLCRAVCQWAGVPVAETDYGQLARDLAAMYESAASLGPSYLRARGVRSKRDRWAMDMIENVRAGRIEPREGSALAVIAGYRDLRGQVLDSSVAAVELQNVLRPTVAVSVFITFAALALHEHPDCRQQISSGDSEYVEAFAQEVRRYYPFFPAVAARVREDFEWRGYHFPRDTRVILGIHATNHDPRHWDSPEQFRPDRFRDWNDDPFIFIPQGGGQREQHHRCPGDRISVELIKTAAQFLCDEIRYDVPKQDLRLAWSQLPPLPYSRFVIRNVRVNGL